MQDSLALPVDAGNPTQRHTSPPEKGIVDHRPVAYIAVYERHYPARHPRPHA